MMHKSSVIKIIASSIIIGLNEEAKATVHMSEIIKYKNIQILINRNNINFGSLNKDSALNSDLKS